MSKETLVQKMRRWHKESHPDCEWGDTPHFVPPCFGDPGFYLCETVPSPPSAHPETETTKENDESG